MKIRRFRSRALSLCLIVVIVTAYSMVALAGGPKIAGEISVSGTSVNGETPIVTVNGAEIRSGRSIFSSSSITTDQNSSALINLGKLATLSVGPGTSLVLSFDENGVKSDLLSGKVTVIDSPEVVIVTMPDGSISKLTAGNSATTLPQDDDDDDNVGSNAWWIWAIVVGGAAAAIIAAAAANKNRVDLGAGTTIVSPVA